MGWFWGSSLGTFGDAPSRITREVNLENGTAPCKSRLCTHCGKKYADQWAAELSLRMFDVTHRHMVFTVSHILRPYLEKDRK